MTRRYTALLAIFLAAGLAATAQDKPVAPATQMSGTVTLGVGNQNLLGSPYVSGIPGFSSGLTSGLVSLKFADGAGYSYLDVSQQAEEIRRSTRMGYEVGVVLDAASLYAYTAATTKTSSNSDSSFYSLLQPMLDWYENNWQRYGMASNPYASGSWPTDGYDGSSSGRTRFIYGKTAEPINCISWDTNKWYDAQKLVSEIKLKIELAIDKISPDAASGKIVDQYALLKLTEERQELARQELQAWTEFHVITDGVDTKAALLGPIIKTAFVKFTNIGGALDARLDFAGMKLSNGRLIPSGRMDQPATGPALGLALPVGLVPNFNLSATASLVGGKASIIENFETKNSEAYAGEAAWLGLKLKTGYSIPDFADFGLSVLWPDMASRPRTMGATLEASFRQDGPVSYSACLEGSGLLWQDRYIADAASIFAYAGGVDARMTVLGFTPRVLALYKSAGYWAANDSGNSSTTADNWVQAGNNAEDRFYGYGLRGDFNSVKVKDAVAAEGGLKFDPVGVIGMKLFSIEGGYRALFYNLAENGLTPLGRGWFAGFTFTLEDLAKLPLSLSAKASNYTNWGIYAGSYADWDDAASGGLLAGISWNASVDWTPSSEATISLEGSGRDSGWRMDSKRLVSVGLKASIRF